MFFDVIVCLKEIVVYKDIFVFFLVCFYIVYFLEI